MSLVRNSITYLYYDLQFFDNLVCLVTCYYHVHICKIPNTLTTAVQPVTQTIPLRREKLSPTVRL